MNKTIKFWVFLIFAAIDFYSDLLFVVYTVTSDGSIQGTGTYGITAQTTFGSTAEQVQVVWLASNITIIDSESRKVISLFYNFTKSSNGMVDVQSTDPNYPYALKVTGSPLIPSSGPKLYGILNYEKVKMDPPWTQYKVRSLSMFLFYVDGYDSFTEARDPENKQSQQIGVRYCDDSGLCQRNYQLASQSSIVSLSQYAVLFAIMFLKEVLAVRFIRQVLTLLPETQDITSIAGSSFSGLIMFFYVSTKVDDYMRKVRKSKLPELPAKTQFIWNLAETLESLVSLLVVYGANLSSPLILGAPLPQAGLLKVGISAIGMPMKLYGLLSYLCCSKNKTPDSSSDKDGKVEGKYAEEPSHAPIQYSAQLQEGSGTHIPIQHPQGYFPTQYPNYPNSGPYQSQYPPMQGYTGQQFQYPQSGTYNSSNSDR